MRTRLACLLAALALTACNAPVSPAGQASSRPKASADVHATPTPAGAIALLQPPAGTSTVLAGTLRIDAAYAYNTGAGKLLRPDGSGLISNDGGSLIGNDGAGLIGNDGAGILIGGSGLITNDGGGLITNDGAGIVAQGAGNLISKRKYGLAATTGVKMAIGTLLRAAGMELQVVDMATNQPLALGQDEANHEVFSILTNAGGGFKVYLPATLNARNVRIQASALGLLDDRLTYQTVTPFKANEATAFDEDTALLARYVRGAFAARIERVFKDAQKKGSFIALLGSDTPPALTSLIQNIGTKVEQASAEAHADQYSDAQRRAAALASADAILGTMDLEAVTTSDPGKLMLAELRDVLHGFRDATAKAMRAQPTPAAGQGYFQEEPWLVEANRAAATPADRFLVQTPADLGEFVLRYVLTNPDRVKQKTLADVFVSVGYDPANYDRVQAAMTGLLNAIFGALIPLDDEHDSPAMTNLLKAIKAGPGQ